MWVMTRAYLNNLVSVAGGNGSDSAAVLDGSFEALIKAPYGPTVDSLLTDPALEEADYEGYARQANAAWTPPFVGQNGKSLTSAEMHVWSPTGDDTVNTIHGHMLIGADSATLLGCEMFDEEIPQVDADSGFPTVPIVGLDPNQNYGSSLVGN